jgi:hypothetical protein
VANRPIGQSGWDPGDDDAKQTQLPEAGHRGGVEESAGRQNTQHSTILSFHHSSPMPMVQNKANFALCPMGRGLATKAVAGNRAKQSQTWAGWEIWGTAYQGRMLCQTNPIRPGSGRHRGRNVPNKPNPAPGASVVGVKQSQFREGWIDAQVPCRKGIMTVLTHRWPQENKANSQAGSQSRVCQTKPIPGAGLSPASGRLLLGRDEYNGWESFFRFSRAHFGRVGTPIYER